MLAGNSIITKAIASGDWTAHRDGVPIGVDALKIGPHSIDVSLGGIFVIPCPTFSVFRSVFDPYDENQKEVRYTTVKADFYDLRPGEFILSCVRERFDCGKAVKFANRHMITEPDPYERCTQHYDGRSTMGRLGIISHATAGYGDLGFASNFTLELTNLNPHIIVRLHRGMRIGQVSFHAVANTGDVVEYQGSYTQQHDVPVVPRLGASKFLQPGEGFDPSLVFKRDEVGRIT